MQTSRGITYYVYGAGSTAVFCHPSLGLGRFLFHRIIPVLSRYYTVVTWDPRGVGDNRLFAPSLDNWVADTCDIIREVGKPAHLFGVSLGTWVMARVSTVDPDASVRSLVLLGATPGFSDGEAAVQNRRKELEAGGMKAFSVRYAHATVTDYALPEVRENLAKELGEVDPEMYLRAMKEIYATSNIDVFPKISVPTLVMVGAEDQRTPPDEADLVCSLVPCSEEKVLYRCGHLALLDQPARVAGECRYFWTYGHAADD